MTDKEDIQQEVSDLVDYLGGPVETAERLGVSRQTIWSWIKGNRSGSLVYLYALRYLFFLPTLRSTKAFKEYEGNLKARKS